jgi:hypothetical protein
MKTTIHYRLHAIKFILPLLLVWANLTTFGQTTTTRFNDGFLTVFKVAAPPGVSFSLSCTTNATTTITTASTATLVVGMSVAGTGIPANTAITSIVSGTSFTITNAATNSATNNLTFNSTLTNTGTGIITEEYLPATAAQSAPNFSAAIPTLTGNRLVVSGTATASGQISRSENGNFLVIPGYNTTPGQLNSAFNTNSAVRTVNGTGTVGAGISGANYSSGNNNLRGATSDDGTNFWMTGNGLGIRHAATAAPTTVTTVSTSSTNNRAAFIYNGQLYLTTGAGTQGIYSVGAGKPTNTGNTSVRLFAPANTDVYGFSISPDGNTIYFVGAATGGGTAGIYRSTFNGSVWTTGTQINTTTGLTGIAVDWTNYTFSASSANGARIYASNPTDIIAANDNGTSLLSVTTLRTISGNNAFRGLAFSPIKQTAIKGINTPATGDISQGASNEELFQFNLSADEGNSTLKKLILKQNGTATLGAGNSISNIRLIEDLDNDGVADAGEISASLATGTVSGSEITFSATVVTTNYIQQGSTRNYLVIGDISGTGSGTFIPTIETTNTINTIAYTSKLVNAGGSLVTRGTGANAPDGNTLTITTAATPSFSFSPASLSGMTANEGSNGTAVNTTISGSNLDPASGSITITAPTNFEVSKDGTSWGASRDFDYTGGNTFNAANNTVYFRIASSAPVGAISDDATTSGGNMTSPPDIALSGTVACVTPVTPSGFSATNGSFQSIVSWTNGSCVDEVLVVAKSSAFTGTPPTPSGDGTAYTADPIFTGAGTAFDGGVVVYKGSGTGVTVTSLTNGTTYTFRIWTRKGTSWSAHAQTTATPVLAAYFWNGGNIAASPADGGTGTWSTANAWRQPDATGVQATWVNGNPAILAGTAGVVSLSANVTATGVDVNTTGYTLTSTNTTTRSITGNLNLANNVALAFNDITATDNRPFSILGNISGGSNASIVMNVNQTGTNTSRLNLASAGATLSLPVTVAVGTTSSGYGNFAIVGTATGTVLTSSATITNNSAYRTSVGATSSNDLTVNGVISGSADLMFAAGSSGGAGTITLNGANDYTGSTIFNAAVGGTIRMGHASAIPSGSAVSMAFTSGNGGIWDLNGFSPSISSLGSGAGGGSITNNNATTNSVLTVNTSIANTFGLPINNGSTNSVGLTKSGSGSLTLSAAGSFSGATTVSAGSLFINAVNTGASATSVSSGATLGGNGTIPGTVSVTGTISPGSTGSNAGTLTTGAQTFSSGATYAVTINNVSGTAGTNWDLLSTASTSNLGANAINIVVGGSITGFSEFSNYTWRIASATGGISGFSAGNVTLDVSVFGTVAGTFSVAQSGNDINLVYSYTAPSTMTPSSSSLSGFTYVAGSGPSTSQNITLNCANLSPTSGTISITGSTNFDVSSDNSTFGASASISYSAATFATSAPIYIRLKSGLVFGSYGPETIAISGGTASTSVSVSGTVSNPPFTSGNLAVFQAASNTLNNTTGTILELIPGSTNAVAVNTFPISGTAAPGPVRFSGSAASTAYMANSQDGSQLLVTGHNSSTTGSNANTLNPRTVVRFLANGSYSIPATYTGTSGQQTRCATTIDNTNYYIADQAGAYTNGTSAASPTGNLRGIKAFGNTIYVGQNSSTSTNIEVSTLSAITGGTISGLTGLTNNSSFQDFYLISSGSSGSTYDVLYILRSTSATAGTIAKYSLVSGTWTANGSYTTNFGGFGLLAERHETGANLWVTTGTGATAANNVIKLNDAAGFNTAINITTGSNVTVYTSAAGTTLKGVAFAPGNPRVNIYVSATQGFEALEDEITVSVIASSPVSGNQTVNIAVSGVLGSDYYNTFPASITILDGQTTGTATFKIANDAFVEGLETATLTISSPSSGIVLGAFTARNINIIDDESNPIVSIAVSPSSGSEAAATSVTVSANTTGNVIGDQYVTVTVSGTGITSGDYTIADDDLVTPGIQILIPDGTNTGDITFTIVNDLEYEGTETATLTIGSPTFGITLGAIATRSANVAITDNEPFITTGSQIFIGTSGSSSVARGSSRNIIFACSITPTIANATFTGLSVPLDGTYSLADLPNNAATFRLWYVQGAVSPDTLNFYSYATTLLATSNRVASGGDVVFSGFSQTIPDGSRGRIWITVDIDGSATLGNTIRTAQILNTNLGSRFTFTTTGGVTGVTIAASSEQTIYAPATLTDVIVPQYMQGNRNSTGTRVPVAYRATVSGLTANTTYRFTNQVVTSTDASNVDGGGNAIYTTGANYVRTTSASLTTNYGSFTTDGTGSYTGWFISESTGNDRFIPGTNMFFRISINDGASGTSAIYRVTTTNAAKLIDFAAANATDRAKGIYGLSNGEAKNLVCLYDNTTGSGRPVSVTWIESDGVTPPTGLNGFVTFLTGSSPVNSVSGAWGTVIPSAGLANGIRRIEQLSLADGGSVGCVATDADGIWPSGTVDTRNNTTAPLTDPLVISLTDAPFTLTLGGVSQTAAACAGSNTQIALNGLVPNSTYTINYSIDGVAQLAVAGVAANGTGDAVFNTGTLAIVANGDLLEVTSITRTSPAPSCTQNFTSGNSFNLTVNQTPDITVTGSPVTVCSPVTVDITEAGVPNYVGDANATTGTYTYHSSLAHANAGTPVLTGFDPLEVGTSSTIWMRKQTASGCADVASIEVIASTCNITWTGSTNNQWDVPGNWNTGIVPNTSNATTVFIPAPADLPPGRTPVIPIGVNGSINSIYFYTGATISIAAGQFLDIKGNWTAQSSATVSGEGTVRFNKTIAGFQTISGNTTFPYLASANALSALYIQDGTQFITRALQLITGALQFNPGGALTLISSATHTALIDNFSTGYNGSVNGPVTVQRNITGSRGYRYLSAPTAGATIANYGPSVSGINGLVFDPLNPPGASGFPTCWIYNENDANAVESQNAQSGWVSSTNPSTALITMNGYAVIISGSQTLTFTGTPNSGNYNLPISFTSSGKVVADGFNLIGNPYPSPVSWNAIVALAGNSGQISNVVKRFASNSDYVGQYADWNGVVGTNGANDNIALGQAFFVKALPGASQMFMQNSVRRSEPGAGFFEEQSSIQDHIQIIKLKIKGTKGADEAIIYGDSRATEQYDQEIDATKMMATLPGLPNIYSRSGEAELSINAMPAEFSNKVIPVDVQISEAGKHVIEPSISGIEHTTIVYLEDRLQNKFYDLRMNPSIEVDFAAGNHSERFYLVIGSPVKIVVSNAGCNSNQGSILVQNATGWVNYSISIYNKQGTKIAGMEQATGYQEFNNLQVGEYIVVLVSANGYQVELPAKIEAPVLPDAKFSAVRNPEGLWSETLFTATSPKDGSSYIWDFGDGHAASGNSTISHQYELPGIYKATLTTIIGACSAAESMVIQVLEDGILSIGMDKTQSAWRIYPNPANEALYFEFMNGSNGSDLIEITDVTGRVIKQIIASDVRNGNQIVVQTSDLASGIYNLIVQGKKGSSSKQFVVSH